ncbi:hypothetical protein BC832DRAFT_58346 [Gaertneriomyces semiglobifer]|nr:hypothetical protein BC832DRAFT_58346 [Gaertneriomyces semiglobifer]
MANNYDYIAMLNMDLSPPVSTEVDFQNDLDLWLNTDFIFADTSDNSSTFNQRLQAGNVLDAAAFAPTANVAQYEERQVNKQQVAPQYNPAGISEKPFLPELVPLASPASDVEVTASVQPTAPTAASAVNISPEQISQLLSVLQTPPITDTPATIATSGATEVAAAGQPRQKSDEELDKRRRNTAASARFRAKKKMREQQLEQTAKEMTDRCSVLERRVKEYEMELKWLRQLVTDRDGKKRLRDFYEEVSSCWVERLDRRIINPCTFVFLQVRR